jgi:uncharacterized membrane protein
LERRGHFYFGLTREMITLTMNSPSPAGRISVQVQNSGSATVSGVSIWMRVPENATSGWSASIDEAPVDLLERQHGNALFRVAVLPPLPAGASVELDVITEPRIFRDRFEPIAPAAL